MAFSQDNDVILIKLEGVGNPTVYAPIASDTVKGIASFDSEHFDVNEGKVGFKTDILIGWTERIETLESNKVDKVAGKGLSTNDLTNELKVIYDAAVNTANSASNKINAVTEGAGTSHNTLKKLYDMIVALIGTADADHNTLGKLQNRIAEEIAALVNSAPETLDTLNEIATALGNDPNLATTLTNLIGTKAAEQAEALALAISNLKDNVPTEYDTLNKLNKRIDAIEATDIFKLADATVLVDEVGNPFEDENGRYFVPEYVDKWARAEILKLKEGN